jgi:hypothetical protein
MKIIALVLGLAAGGADPQKCPLPYGMWEPYAPMTDEFNGSALDESRWHPRNPGWLGRQPAFFNPKNVSVREGMLHLEAKKETLPDAPKGYHTWTTAAVKSVGRVRYGYFEIRARAMDSQASSAFWFYDSTPEIWSEIDVFEIGARPQPNNYYMNTHLFYTLVENVHWHKSRIWKAPYNLSKEFHVYGLEWDRDSLRFFVDGKVVREEKNTHWHQPLTLNFDSETFEGWFGLPKDDALPATFSVDYVRAWKRRDGPPDDRPEAVEFAFPGRAGAAETVGRLKAEGGGTLAVKASGGAERPGRVRLEYLDEVFFAAQKKPEIRKDVKVRDASGKALTFSIAWSKADPWKREGRSGAGEAPGKAVPPSNGYHAVGVDVVPPERKPRGTAEVFEFRPDEGTPFRVTVRH